MGIMVGIGGKTPGNTLTTKLQGSVRLPTFSDNVMNNAESVRQKIRRLVEGTGCTITSSGLSYKRDCILIDDSSVFKMSKVSFIGSPLLDVYMGRGQEAVKMLIDDLKKGI